MAFATPTISAIAAAIGEAVQAGVQTPQGQQMRYLPYLGDTFTPPIVLVGIDTVKYHLAMAVRDSAQEYVAMLILSRLNDRNAVLQMEAYMSPIGPSSVMEAIEAPDDAGDSTLGGVVQNVLVTEAGPPDGLKIGDAVYVTVSFKVAVVA